ncbi:hypothetical protein OJF2_55720 [Aquisphaera giovannonii]|uniref:Hydrogenase maturation protease n=1 Tax=Aquisphaera giovannonii TaxID=406548 RepID=A0A5B9W981_9BACT|nr:hydrogenase maturation protease [Aquisphaera giovannonii]QEH36987.1 hypothetical protein OJF2_55720 [Aquisphaera giovannonii]
MNEDGPGRLPLLVIGFGNPLRRDDAAGLVVADRLGAVPRPGWRVLSVPQLVPELAASLAEARTVVFVDAGLPGVADRVRVEAVAPGAAGESLDHAASPRGLLGLCRLAYGRSPDGWLVTVPAEDLGFGEELSGRTIAGIREAVGRIEDLAAGPASGELPRAERCPTPRVQTRLDRSTTAEGTR